MLLAPAAFYVEGAGQLDGNDSCDADASLLAACRFYKENHMSKSFIEGVKTPFGSMVKVLEVNTKEGKKEFGYLPWALAFAFADRPHQETIWANGSMGIPVFGGTVVGIKQFLPDGAEQVTWLPVLNGANQAMPEARITSRDLGDTLNRCRAKAIAMVSGVGLSLYANGETNTLAFLKALGVKPDSDLSRVEPVVSSSPKKSGVYVDWTHALAAARITDPTFRWSVLFHDVIDTSTGEIGSRPYFKMGSGWGVDVEVVYKGEKRTEALPIMGFVEVETKLNGKKMLDHQPLSNPNCHDWNRAVMRCLAKAIAMASGYALNLYAKSEVDSLHVDPLQRKSAEEGASGAEGDEQGGQAVDGASSVDPREYQAVLEQVRAALAAAGRPASGVLAWLGHKDTDDLSVASMDELQRALQALSPPRPAPTTGQARTSSAPPKQASAGAVFL